MNLIRFRVTSFRSIADTGWIDASQVTALIGTNESGKSNILLALWKLKPVREGEIDLKADAPRNLYHQIRSEEKKPVFIQADFELPHRLVQQLVKMTGATTEELQIARVSRSLANTMTVGFPNAIGAPTVTKQRLLESLENIHETITQLDAAGKKEQPLKDSMLSAITVATSTLDEAPDEIDAGWLTEIEELVNQPNLEQGLQKSVIVPAYRQFLTDFDSFVKMVARPNPGDNPEARKLVWSNIPSFVYYANYGNLDSEIYLPHVIANLERSDLGSHEAAKARTLRVLFEFVRLSAQEILELGKEVDETRGQATPEQIHEVAESKKEREILLQSASTELTKEFREWWQQGNYQFRFQADGKHFRIWVRDEIRPEEIELEGRSAGLQWFLSFFLVFLVERSDAHRNAILLLDEPGVSLHPLAQEDLFAFFNNLSATNQIFYTSHSPFMVDPDHLDRVRSVYFDEQGKDKGLTKVSADLRAKEKQQSEVRSVYSVHAALGLSVSPVLLEGCQPIIVDGTSDQYYLSAIKIYLISRGHITPPRELLFLPSGSYKGIKATVPIIAGRDEMLPHIVLDSDAPGRNTATQLKSSLYAGAEDRITMLADVFTITEAEIEDVFPTDFMAHVVTRYLRGPEEEFSDVVKPGLALVPQIEAYAKKHAISLEEGWKVALAKRTKERLLQRLDLMDGETEVVKRWQQLFEKLSV